MKITYRQPDKKRIKEINEALQEPTGEMALKLILKYDKEDNK
jgi:hypothetical protein